MVTVETADESGRLRAVFFNQPWRERQLHPGLQVALFGQAESYRGRLQMTNPVVDLIGDRTGRIVPIYPQSEKAGLTTWEIAGWVETALARSRVRGIADPVPQSVLQRLHLEGREQALRAIHAPESMERSAWPDAGWSSTSCCGCSWRSCCASEPSSRSRWASATSSTASSCRGSTSAAVPADRRPATRHRARSRPTSPARTRCTGCCRATSAPARRSSRSPRCSPPCRAGTRARSWRRPRCSPSSTRSASARCSSDLEVPDDATLRGDRPLRVELLTNRTTAAERRASSAGLADGRVDILIGTHALIQEGVEFAVARRRRDRRAAPLRRRAARGAARRRAATARCPTCS